MGQSSGAGSPVWFACPNERRQRLLAYNYRARTFSYSVPHHDVELTGRTRPYKAGRGHAMGIRSTHVAREYRCLGCGHVGWSNHVELARMAGEGQFHDKAQSSSET